MVIQTKIKGRAYGEYIALYGKKAINLATLVKEAGMEILPRSFLKEMIRFVKRNSLITIYGKDSKNICCMHCLKAHLLRTAHESNLDNQARAIFTFLKYSEGHRGYYIDKKNLIKIGD